MFRPVTRLIAPSLAVRALPRTAVPTQRFLSTAPPTQKSRSWKSLVARLGAAGAVIYYYNTTEVFAEEPRHQMHTLPETGPESEQLPTIEAITEERQQRKAEAAAAQLKAKDLGAQEAVSAPGDVQGLEEEADQQGAFNPETGEINWDCPCLGGMAHGPCGEEFKAAFSCFVFSTEEPKGMDCIDKFKDMQNCFRQHPEVYGAELEADEEDDIPADEARSAYADAASESNAAPSEPKPEPQPSSVPHTSSKNKTDLGLVPESYRDDAKSEKERTKTATEQVNNGNKPLPESDEVIPKAAHDERAANEEKK